MSSRLAIPIAILAALTSTGCQPIDHNPNGGQPIPTTLYEVRITARTPSGEPVRLPIVVTGAGTLNGQPGWKIDDHIVLPFSKDAVTSPYRDRPYGVNVKVPTGQGPYEFTITATAKVTRATFLDTGVSSMDCAIWRDGARLSIVDAAKGSIPFAVKPIQDTGTYTVMCGVVSGG